MLMNPYRDVHALARQGALALLLAMLLGLLVVILVIAPEGRWQSAGRFPALPLPVPDSQPGSRLSQPTAPAPLLAPAGPSDPTLASAASEPAAADQAMAPPQASASRGCAHGNAAIRKLFVDQKPAGSQSS